VILLRNGVDFGGKQDNAANKFVRATSLRAAPDIGHSGDIGNEEASASDQDVRECEVNSMPSGDRWLNFARSARIGLAAMKPARARSSTFEVDSVIGTARDPAAFGRSRPNTTSRNKAMVDNRLLAQSRYAPRCLNTQPRSESALPVFGATPRTLGGTK